MNGIERIAAEKGAEMNGIERIAAEKGAEMNGIERIAAERKRQIEAEGWSLERDRQYVEGELLLAALNYAEMGTREDWPWDISWWKPGTAVRNLEKAGALIAAEIDRLLARAVAP